MNHPRIFFQNVFVVIKYSFLSIIFTIRMASVHLRPVLAIMSIRLFSEWMKWYTFYPDSASWVPPNQMQQGHKVHCRRVTDMSCTIHVFYKEYFEKIHQQMQLLCGIDSKYSLVAVFSHWVIECLNSAPTCEVTAVVSKWGGELNLAPILAFMKKRFYEKFWDLVLWAWRKDARFIIKAHRPKELQNRASILLKFQNPEFFFEEKVKIKW